MESHSLRTAAEAEAYASLHGVRLNATDREAIMKAQQAEQRRSAALSNQSSQTHLIEAFNRLYPRFLEALVGTGDVLITLTQTLIIAFGVPVVLGLLLLVEQQRVVHGIQLFETDPALAAFAAWALVLLNLTLEITIEYVERRASFQASTGIRFSLRIWAVNAAYSLGIGKRWHEQALSPAARYKSVLRLVTGSILVLALAGSMHGAIETTQGAWHVALIQIATESTLLQMFVWLGGLLFAAAAVLSARALSRYVAVRCNEIVARTEIARLNKAQSDEAALQSVAAQYIVAKVNLKHRDTPEVAPKIPLALE